MIPEKPSLNLKNKKSRAYKKKKDTLMKVTEEKSNNPLLSPSELEQNPNLASVPQSTKNDHQANINVVENAS